MAVRGWKRLAGFAVAATVVIAAECGVSRTAAFARGGLVPFAVLLDLMLVLPLLYVALVLRPEGRPLLDAAPSLGLGGLVAGLLLGGREETRALVRATGAATELLVLGLLWRRLRDGARQFRGAATEDLVLRAAAIRDPLLRLLAAELTIFYYAFLGAARRRPLRRHEFGYTEKSGLGGVLFGFAFLTGCEGVGLHFVLHAIRPALAWAFAGMNVYAIIWFFAAWQAAHLRPVAVTADSLLVRTSLLWTARVPRALIAEVVPIDDADRAHGLLRAALGTAPVLLFRLRGTIEASGPFGISRRVDRIALYIDEPEALRAALTA